MRPVKLIMSAFGSYSGTEIIDFTKMQQGIFLITGDTGAGKTTIFDAVTYALYDRTSGGIRDGNMMRSQYSSEDIPTYVEYVFSYRDQEYTVRRNPEYFRVGKRKGADGSPRFVKETAKVSLIMPDGSEFQGRKKETENKIEEIIGLDVNQFTQIAMIAQGDFMKLLLAESRERKRIFSRIFQTKIYWQIQEELKAQSKQLYIQLEDNQKDCRREMERVEAQMESEYAQSWQELMELKMPSSQEVMEVLKGIRAEGKQKEKEAEGEAGKFQKQADELNVSIRSREESNKLFLQLTEITKKREELLEEKDQMQELDVQVKAGARAEKVWEKEKHLRLSEKELENLIQNVNCTKVWIKEHTDRLTVEKEDEKKLRDELAEKEPLLQEQIVRLQDVIPRFEQISRLQSQYQKAEKAMRHSMEECREASEKYEEKYRLFFAEQAGILARELEEGKPCPVCGSVLHPRKAGLSGKAPGQEEVQQAKEKREKADAKRSNTHEKFQATKSQLESEQKVLQEVLEKNDLAGASDSEAKAKLNDLKVELRHLQDVFEEKTKQVQKQTEELKRQSGLLESQETQHNELLRRSRAQEEEFQKEIKSQKFNNQDEYQVAKQWADGREKQEKKLRAYETMMIEADTRYHMLKQQTEGKKQENLAEDKENLKELYQQQKRQKAVLMQLHSRNERNREVSGKLKQYFGDREELKKQYEVVGNLNRTANGNLSGSAKLDFETYVQRRYFKQIIQAANRRLSKMTSNEFILQCREIKDLSSQGQAGLDLDVYHLVNDSVRDVKTLSGGESFMASLSMALGLADIVQNTAGAISLETMFIDEGFGSLDDAARERAIQILQELAGEKGLVGIISHVNELKEQIECKLIVTKTEHGSSAKWEME